jgi:hypothetical protein
MNDTDTVFVMAFLELTAALHDNYPLDRMYGVSNNVKAGRHGNLFFRPTIVR